MKMAGSISLLSKRGLKFKNIFQRSSVIKIQNHSYQTTLLKKKFDFDLKNCTVVDLRSDTVSIPTADMKRTMLSAPLGDDVYGEDPTVRELETCMAELSKKAAALFVTSGTMGNLLSVMAHCQERGSEVILGDQSHIFHREQAHLAQFGGIQSYIVNTLSDGTFDLDHLTSCIRDDQDFHSPSTQLICIENTLGRRGGQVLPHEWVQKLEKIAKERSVPIHLDGARVFNACATSGKSLAELLYPCDSASICFSKGLGAPVGAILVGSEQFISRARRLRKAIGGGWRQAGVLAAAALYALEHNVPRLVKDHQNAQLLANEIDAINLLSSNKGSVDSNMVTLTLEPQVISPEDFCLRLLEITAEEERHLGGKVIVKAFPSSKTAIRFVTHLGVSTDDINAAIGKLRFVASEIENSR